MEVLSSFVLAMHLVCMNVFAAGPLVCAWLDRKAERHTLSGRTAIQRIAWLSCTLMLVGAILGLLVGWFRWDALYRQTLSQFSYRLHWGLLEFAFSGLLTLAYAIWLWRRPVVGTGQWLARTFLAVLSATNLLYHFPPLFALVGTAASGQLEIEGHVDSAAFVRLIGRGDVTALSVHFALASFAVAGLALALVSPREPQSDQKPALMIAAGARFALVSTVAQIPVGLWLVMELPVDHQRRIMGADGLTATLFVSAMLGTFLLLHQLGSLAFGSASRKKVWQAAMSMGVVITLMTFVMERGRGPSLARRAYMSGPSQATGEAVGRVAPLPRSLARLDIALSGPGGLAPPDQ